MSHDRRFLEVKVSDQCQIASTILLKDMGTEILTFVIAEHNNFGAIVSSIAKIHIFRPKIIV